MNYTEKELENILKKHKLWIENNPKGARADLRGADLRSANLSSANLSSADLSSADLRSANLRGADLSSANLWGANLSIADLWGANLSSADLRGANLSSADLRGANLWGANLRGAKNMYYPMVCPEKGSFTAFKKASGFIIELFIPSNAKRSSSTSRKCRCDKAKVMSITHLSGAKTDITEVMSGYDNNFVYKLGEYVEVKDFDDNRWNECAPGIHFFITRDEAVNY